MFKDKISTDKVKIGDILSRGVAEAIDRKSLEDALLSGKKLRIKLGIDPTSPDIHLGRATVLWKLRAFQELGHQVVFIIGDFTGTIGDTSDKESERPMLSPDTVKRNMKEYAAQAGKILNMKKAEVKYNSTWLGKLTYSEIGFQADAFSLSDFIDRDNVKRRLDQGSRVSLRETLYPLMQGYDSVAVEADVELGGTDQKFNLLAGRTLQRAYKQKPQNILMMDLIPGTDGRKMSSSWGNTIVLADNPNDMFGKIMSLPDNLIETYFVHTTRVSMEEIKNKISRLSSGENPKNIKIELAQEIVRMYHGQSESEKALAYFKNTFEKKEIPTEIPAVDIAGKNITEALVLAKLAESKSEARRLVLEKAIKVNGEVTTLEKTISSGDTIQKGKRFFAKAK